MALSDRNARVRAIKAGLKDDATDGDVLRAILALLAAPYVPGAEDAISDGISEQD